MTPAAKCMQHALWGHLLVAKLGDVCLMHMPAFLPAWGVVPKVPACTIRVGLASLLGPSLKDFYPMPRRTLERHLHGSACWALCPGHTLQSFCSHAECFYVEVTRPHHTISYQSQAERLPPLSNSCLAVPATWCAAPWVLGAAIPHHFTRGLLLQAWHTLQAPAAIDRLTLQVLLSADCRDALCQSRLTLKYCCRPCQVDVCLADDH